MHTLTRRAGDHDDLGYDLNALYRKLNLDLIDGVDLIDEDLLPEFNRFKAAGGEQWDEIRAHCEDWDGIDEDEESD